jgi:hypothetical protein
MVNYLFKLMGVMSETAEKMIDVETNDTVQDVKEKLRQAYKLAPIFTIELLVDGAKLVDRHMFNRIGINPKKQKILVIVTRNQ